MKAWWAEEPDQSGYAEWGMFVHGETPSRAKVRAWRCEPSGEWEYKNIRVTRRPKLDGLPFTQENVGHLVYDPEMDEGFWYTNDCNCEICLTTGVIGG